MAISDADPHEAEQLLHQLKRNETPARYSESEAVRLRSKIIEENREAVYALTQSSESHRPTSEDSTIYANMEARNEVKAVRADSEEVSPETKMAGEQRWVRADRDTGLFAPQRWVRADRDKGLFAPQRWVRADRDKGLIASLLRRVQFMGGPMSLCPLKCSGTTGRQDRRQWRKAIVESELCWA